MGTKALTGIARGGEGAVVRGVKKAQDCTLSVAAVGRGEMVATGRMCEKVEGKSRACAKTQSMQIPNQRGRRNYG